MQLKTYHVGEVEIADVIANIEQSTEIQSRCTILDSSEFDDQNQTTYICIQPKHLYEMRGNDVYVDGICIGSGKDCLYEKMRKILKAYAITTEEAGFFGGFVGYISYEATPLFLGVSVKQDFDGPCIAFRFYTQWMKIVKGVATVYTLGETKFSEWEDVIKKRNSGETTISFFSDVMENEQHYQSSLDESAFISGVKHVHKEIVQGNVYQLNLTRRLRRNFKNQNDFNIMTYYNCIRKKNKAPYGVLWLDQAKALQFASSSPEQFFQLRNNTLITKPIKGTRPRKNNREKDNAMYEELQKSTKDHAELLMITDLLRNDLNKTVENNSVEVVEFAEVCQNPTVYHLVSTIQAILPKNKDAFDVLDGLFPGGSITGAPKKAAVEYIDMLETCGRGLYTGSAGYISVNNDADFNILIRTLFQKHDTIDIHVGGGIVYESVPHLEYLETRQKAKALLHVVEEISK